MKAVLQLCYVSEESSDGKESFCPYSAFSSEDSSILLADSGNLQSFYQNLSRMTAITTTYREFIAFYNTHNEYDELLIPEMERRLRAYFLEFGVFLNHWERYIKHHAQKKEYLQLYKDLTHNAYDRNSNYAFASFLRNYATHAGDLIQSSFYGNGHFEIGCFSDIMLKDSSLKAKERELIKRQPAKFIPLLPIVEGSFIELQAIHRELMLFQIDSTVINACKRMIDFSCKIGNDLDFKKWAIVEMESFSVLCARENHELREPVGSGHYYHPINWKIQLYIALNILSIGEERER